MRQFTDCDAYHCLEINAYDAGTCRRTAIINKIRTGSVLPQKAGSCTKPLCGSTAVPCMRKFFDSMYMRGAPSSSSLFRVADLIYHVAPIRFGHLCHRGSVLNPYAQSLVHLRKCRLILDHQDTLLLLLDANHKRRPPILPAELHGNGSTLAPTSGTAIPFLAFVRASHPQLGQSNVSMSVHIYI